jgi:hypothetical protein
LCKLECPACQLALAAIIHIELDFLAGPDITMMALDFKLLDELLYPSLTHQIFILMLNMHCLKCELYKNIKLTCYLHYHAMEKLSDHIKIEFKIRSVKFANHILQSSSPAIHEPCEFPVIAL